jgi:hypothetical protein
MTELEPEGGLYRPPVLAYLADPLICYLAVAKSMAWVFPFN